ncbi:MAG: Crp/Fnr family transcriptional regulator [Pseudomonadota bacterium]
MATTLLPRDGSPNTDWPTAFPPELAEHGTLVHTRPGQPLPLSLSGKETVFFVRMATLLFRLSLADDLRQGVTLLYPGDVFRSAFAPSGAAASLVSLTSGEVLRYRYDAFFDLLEANSDARRYFDQAIARQTARQAIHLAAVGQLDSEQRLVSFLVELATQIGVAASDGRVVFEMPLSRSEVAEYLGLNADTLSRIMSRLRGKDYLTQPDRHTVFVRNLSELAALSPASGSLMALRRSNEASPASAEP